MRGRRNSLQEQNGGCILGTGFAIEDFQPLHVKPAIENRRRNFVRHLNSPFSSLDSVGPTSPAREFQLRRRYAIRESSRTNADDCLSLGPFDPVEGRDGIVEGSYGTDVCPQPTVPGPLDDFTQLSSIGFDDEIDCLSIISSCFGWFGNSYHGYSNANHAHRTLRAVAT